MKTASGNTNVAVSPSKGNKKAAVKAAAFPSNKTPIFLVGAALSFIVNFVLYLSTVAPTVTFEDSGEFIAAAYNLGVPHEPGYPLFTMLAKVFTFLPFGTIAYRVNLLSAFTTALSCSLLFWSTVLIIENLSVALRPRRQFHDRTVRIIRYSVGLLSALLFGCSFTCWQQAIITEVYGLNSFFVASFILISLLLGRQADEKAAAPYFCLICFLLGLALTNHTTSLMLIPIFGIYVFLIRPGLLKRFTLLVKGLSLFCLGLTPYLYLPLTSWKNPIIDWGNPENVKNFFRVIMRHQYGGKTTQTFENFFSQFWVFLSDLLVQQWFPIILILAGAGLWLLFKKNKPYFFFSLSFLIFCMPITTWMTNFDVTSPSVAFEHRALVSVFYIPAYFFLSLLISVGAYYCISFIEKERILLSMIGLFVPIITAATIAKNFSTLTMHDYYFARDYADNLFSTLPRNSLLFVHWDPYSFPLIYFQFVEGKRPDLRVIDDKLLKRSWYVQWLREHFPDFTKPSEKEIAAFLQAVKPFEEDTPYNGPLLQKSYIDMINSFIDNKLQNNSNVYFTYTPEQAIIRSYHLEPVLSAYKYTKGDIDTTITDADLKLSAFSDKNRQRDRMANYLRDYYGNLFGLRGMFLESKGRIDWAREYYGKARLFFNDDSQQARFLDQKIQIKQ